MIIVELVDEGTRERRYSDKNVKLRQIETGNVYEDAVDVIPCRVWQGNQPEGHTIQA